jgi:hypothetical protein
LVVPVVAVAVAVEVDWSVIVVVLPLVASEDVEEGSTLEEVPCDPAIDMKSWRMRNKGMGRFIHDGLEEGPQQRIPAACFIHGQPSTIYHTCEARTLRKNWNLKLYNICIIVVLPFSVCSNLNGNMKPNWH